MRLFLLLISVSCVPVSFYGQDLVQTEGIKSALHKNNLHQVLFTSKRVVTQELKQADFLREYTLTNNNDLFFIAFMDNSLTNYKHRLLPGVNADSLSKIGNYQFTLLVDNKEIYRSNLLPGAPYASIQDTATIVNRPLVNNTDGTGSWSESFWNRFLRNGGDSALTDGRHLLRMEIRPYIKTDSVITGDLIAAGELKLQVLRHPKIDASKIKLTPLEPYDGFAISKDRFNEKKIKELKGNIKVGIFKKINSVVVIKNGKLLIEEYFNNETRTSLHDPRSVGKSFASTMMGIAIHDGLIKSEEETLSKLYDLKSFANYSDLKANTSIKELLTMSSGFDGNDDDPNSPGNEENMYPATDWVKFALDLPVRQVAEWKYFTAGVIVLGDILNRKVPGGLDRYADEKLFKPLNITNYKWQYTPQQVPNTAGGVRMNALDFAKYGQLYKNGGTWNNKQIISKDWINKTFTKQKQVPGRTNEFYGYLFWNKQYQVQDKSYEAFYCAGNGGNYILVFKDIPVVIVITASAYGQAYAHPQVTKIISDYILPAILQ